MRLDILMYPDPRLRQICAPVTEITPEIRNLAADMLETMYAAPGVGLAAPQVGHFIRMLVMDVAGNEAEKSPRILINPVLELFGDDVVSEREGCLSVPMLYRADIHRKSGVRLSAQDIDGNDVQEILEGFPAIVVQHEIEHLDGILFIDHLTRLRRSLFDAKVKKWLRQRNAD